MKRILSLFFILTFSFLSHHCSNGQKVEIGSDSEKSIAVETLTLEPSSFYEYLEITGTVKARNQINIVAEEGGILKKIERDKGKYARKGDTLAVLENKVIEAAYKEAFAALKQAELNFNSSNILFGKQAISENEYLASKYNLDRVQAAYDLAAARYGKLFIVASIRGIVNARYYDFGAYVMPMTPLFEFIDIEKVKVEAGIAERFLSDIQIGTAVTLTFDAYPEVQKEAKVTFVSRAIDPVSRTFLIEAELDNEDKIFAPQMISNLKILRKAYSHEIVIPIDALLNSEEGRFVFITEDNRAKQVKIEVLAIHEDSVLVRGLDKHQELIVLGQQDLSDGESIVTSNKAVVQK